MAWTKDAKLESQLKKLGVKWHYETIKLKEVLVQESRKNNARIGSPLIDDVVVDYGLALMNGDSFPAICVVKHENGYFVLSGNHRTAAAGEADLQEIDAYVIESDDAMVAEVIVRTANRWHGARQSNTEAVQHAIALINGYGISKKEAADLMGLRHQWFYDQIRTEELREELGRLGIDTRKIPRTTIQKLSPLSGNENVFREAARVLNTYQVSGDQTNELIEALKMQKSETASMKVIADREAEWRTEQPRHVGSIKLPQRSRFLRSFNSLIHTIAGKRTLKELQIVSIDEQSELLDKWEHLRTRLDTIFGVKHVTETNGKAQSKVQPAKRLRVAVGR